MSRIIIVGAGGTIGSAVAALLERDHEIIRVAHSHGDHTVDLSSQDSIEKLFQNVPRFDALVCAAGPSRFGSLMQATEEDFLFSIRHKLMGQVNLARAAQRRIHDKGCITLTSGLLGRKPLPATVPTAMVNAAIDGFVRAAALDLDRGIRINAVSPVFVTETAKRMGMAAAGTMPASQTALAYKHSIEGEMSGEILDVRDYGRLEGSRQ